MYSHNNPFDIAVLEEGMVLDTGSYDSLDLFLAAHAADAAYHIFDVDTKKSATNKSTQVYIVLKYKNGSLKFIGDPGIETHHVNSVVKQDYIAPVPHQVMVRDFQAVCNQDYTLRLVFSNGEILQTQGVLPYAYTYSVRTGCCDGCNDCAKGDPNVLAYDIYKALKRDVGNAPFLVEMIDAGANGLGTTVLTTDSAIETAIEDYKNTGTPVKPEVPSGFLFIRLTAVPGPEFHTGLPINYRYYAPRDTRMEVSLLDGAFCGRAKVVETKAPVYEVGSGYDLRQKEYIAGGWNGNPGIFRMASDVVMMRSEFMVDDHEKYDTVTLDYTLETKVGSAGYRNRMHVIFAAKAKALGGTAQLQELHDKLIEYVGR